MYYFSYGSNMLSARLVARVGGVACFGPARLAGYRLSFSKRSIDGSGKCTLTEDHPSASAWGVVFDLTLEQKRLLNEFEGPGYAVESVFPVAAGRAIEAFTYIGRPGSLDGALLPYTWYKELVLTGAVQAGLPHRHIAAIESVAATEDPDQGRARSNLRLIKALP